jgi:hypothetical protein
MAKLKVTFAPFLGSGIFKFTSFHRQTTGERSLVRRLILLCVNSVSDLFLAETMIDHRARTLFALLPIALATGYSEVEPDLEPLKVLEANLLDLRAVPLIMRSGLGYRHYRRMRRHPYAFCHI